MKTGNKTPIFDKARAEKYESWYETRKGRRFDNLEKELMFKLVHPRYDEKLLDVGCGTGHHLKWLKVFGLRLTGVDISEDMLNVARKSLDKDIELRVADAQELPYEDNSFDIVIIVTTLEMVDAPEAAIKEALRVSKNRVFLGILNKYSVLSVKRKIKGIFINDPFWKYPNFFSIKKIIRLIENINNNLLISWKSLYGRNPFSSFIGILIKKENKNDPQ